MNTPHPLIVLPRVFSHPFRYGVSSFTFMPPTCTQSGTTVTCSRFLPSSSPGVLVSSSITNGFVLIGATMQGGYISGGSGVMKAYIAITTEGYILAVQDGTYFKMAKVSSDPMHIHIGLTTRLRVGFCAPYKGSALFMQLKKNLLPRRSAQHRPEVVSLPTYLQQNLQLLLMCHKH